MTTRNRISMIAVAIGILSSIDAFAFDLLRLNCFLRERQDDLIFYSEIHFRKTGSANHPVPIPQHPSPYEGELLSYSIQGDSKKYVSGYTLFSISYRDQMISGLTGNPVTHTDGSFTLIRTGDKNTGIWKFSHIDTGGSQVTANFHCTYFDSLAEGR